MTSGKFLRSLRRKPIHNKVRNKTCNTIRNKARIAITVMLLLTGAPVLADNIQPFDTSTFASIKADYAGKPFLVSLWSIDCPPCLVELDLLGKLVAANPHFPLVLISTDPIDKLEESRFLLEDYGLSDTKSWIFADAFVERLRYTIDPQWYGELPRSYFYADSHQFTAHSGTLNEEMLNEFAESLK